MEIMEGLGNERSGELCSVKMKIITQGGNQTGNAPLAGPGKGGERREAAGKGCKSGGHGDQGALFLPPRP